MSCSNKFIQAIENKCNPVKGLQPLAYWCYRSDVNLTIVNNTINAISTTVLGVFNTYKAALNAGHDVVVVENQPNRFKHKFTATVNESSVAIDSIDDIIVFVKTTAGNWLAYGAEFGLWKDSQAQMFNDNLATIALSFGSRDGMEEKYESYNVTADLSLLPNMLDYSYITGLQLLNNSNYSLKVDASKKGYIKFPDGTLSSTTSGVLTGSYSGLSGNMYIYVDKNSSYFDIGGIDPFYYNGKLITNFFNNISGNSISGVFTEINANNSTYINFQQCSNLGNAVCTKATSIYLTGCALTVNSIAILLKNAVNTGASNGIINISGGTNAAKTGWSSQAVEDYNALVARGWTITYNA